MCVCLLICVCVLVSLGLVCFLICVFYFELVKPDKPGSRKVLTALEPAK